MVKQKVHKLSGYISLRTCAASALGILALLMGRMATVSNAQTTTQSWVVAFHNANGLPANVDDIVAKAGGTIVAKAPEIGGLLATSSDPNFGAAMANNNSVLSSDIATSTQLIEPSDPSTASADNNGGNYSPTGSDAQAMPDSLGSEQWDKKKMNATTNGSYAIQRGRRDVRVFVIDTGVDQNHVDIAANLSPQAPAGDSVSFVPTEPTIQDFNGHGTWTASAVGAPINGTGISGVAPNVTIVAGKVLSGTGGGLFFWTDQALIYAGLKHFDVVSASLGGYIPKNGNKSNSKANGPGDHTDYILLQRSTQFARSNGVLPVAALGNDGVDLSDGNFFRAFIEAPGEVAGWVGVAATGYTDGKAFYSNYGMGKTDVSAPGGSTRDYSGVPGSSAATCPHGSLCRLIGAWSQTAPPTSQPANPVEICTGPGATPPCFEYGYVQGTSMATPNAAGVAALIISQYGDFAAGGNPNKIHMSPTTVEQYLQISANNQPCPEPNTVRQGPNTFGPLTATCQGDSGYNSFFGKGIVDALKAVTLKTNK